MNRNAAGTAKPASDEREGARGSENPREKPLGSTEASTESELREIQQLAKRDREVRAHEQAHSSVGGAFAGSPSYEYQRGSNGVSYAVGGRLHRCFVGSRRSCCYACEDDNGSESGTRTTRAFPSGSRGSNSSRSKAAYARMELAEVRLEASYGKTERRPEPGKVVDVSV